MLDRIFISNFPNIPLRADSCDVEWKLKLPATIKMLFISVAVLI